MTSETLHYHDVIQLFFSYLKIQRNNIICYIKVHVAYK